MGLVMHRAKHLRTIHGSLGTRNRYPTSVPSSYTSQWAGPWSADCFAHLIEFSSLMVADHGNFDSADDSFEILVEFSLLLYRW
jgi:hypothetical protein